MKLKLTFKEGEKIIEKEIEVNKFTLMSMLKDEVITEISKQIGSEVYINHNCYLTGINDKD